MISKLHFISQETAEFTHLECIAKACRAGVEWVQLRVKDKPVEDIITLGRQAKQICDAYGAKLIINDHPLVAKEIGAYGLHLGKEDMPVDQARAIVGHDVIIGGTANTLEDIVDHVKNGANYIGCGPFRFTTTKAKLSPILGLEGYRRMMAEIKKLGITIPVIAIGGIETADIPAILETGVSGIAVSSLIALADDPQREVDNTRELLKGEKTVC